MFDNIISKIIIIIVILFNDRTYVWLSGFSSHPILFIFSLPLFVAVYYVIYKIFTVVELAIFGKAENTTVTNIKESYTHTDNIKISNRVNESRIRPKTLKYHHTVKEQKTQQLEIDKVKKQQDNDYYYKRKMARKGYWKVTPKQIREMDWREFESFVADLLTEHGYKTILTPAQKDEGKDIVAEKDGIKYFIECKHWKEGSSVGREYLQKLVGAAAGNGVTNVIFIATCSFHDNAKVYAKEINKSNMFHLELWNINKLLKVANSIPLNAQQKAAPT